jgi:hypothetical protein
MIQQTGQPLFPSASSSTKYTEDFLTGDLRDIVSFIRNPYPRVFLRIGAINPGSDGDRESLEHPPKDSVTV